MPTSIRRSRRDMKRGAMLVAVRLAARRAFGGIEPMKCIVIGAERTLSRQVRATGASPARLLVRERWFMVVVVLALSLGIAANSTVSALINGSMLRDLLVCRSRLHRHDRHQPSWS